MVIADGMIRSDIEVMSVLKGDTKQGTARIVSQYWPRQGERFLMFATYQSNQLYNATETYRIVPIGRDFPTHELTGETLVVHLSYPRDVKEDFLKQFTELVNDFGKHVD